jgi:hypothetical protein
MNGYADLYETHIWRGVHVIEGYPRVLPSEPFCSQLKHSDHEYF